MAAAIGNKQNKIRDHDQPVLSEDTEDQSSHPQTANTASQGTPAARFAFFQLLFGVTTFSCSFVLSDFMYSQWIYQSFSHKILGNLSVDSRSHPCINSTSDSDNTTADSKMLTQHVQSLTSDMLLNIGLIFNIMGIVGCIVLGVASRKMSRRTLLCIPSLLVLVYNVLISIIYYCDLDANWLYPAAFIYGFGGGYSAVIMGVFLYTSDVTPRDRKRTVGVTIVEVVKGSLASCTAMVAGYLVEGAGFFVSRLCCCGLCAVTIVAFCMLPDLRSHKDQTLPKSPKEIARRIISPFTEGLRTKRYLVALVTLSYFLIVVSSSGESGIQSLFLMNLPFCFDSITIGWVHFVRDISENIFAILMVGSLSKHLPGMYLSIIGATSELGGYMMLCFATTKTEVFMAPLIGIGQLIPFAVTRGEASRLCPPDQQGPLFATLAVVESIGVAICVPIFQSLYSHTQNSTTGTGTAFLLAAALLVVAMAIMVIYQVKWIKFTKAVSYQNFGAIGNIGSGAVNDGDVSGNRDG